jgi:hypothetical protein
MSRSGSIKATPAVVCSGVRGAKGMVRSVGNESRDEHPSLSGEEGKGEKGREIMSRSYGKCTKGM